MSNTLYPLKFKPVYKTTIWGGNVFKNEMNRTDAPDNCGESWEISGVDGNISVVSNGFLAGNNLEELLEIYMGDIVGDCVYERFGNEFPLLIKFIDADDNLSVQVHPDDELAEKRHNSFGKTEMWYVLDHKPGAALINGFSKEISKDEYLEALNNKHLSSILNSMEVNKGDVFFIPAGRVHAIGKGITIAEIQQTSNITYRIYDFDRVDKNGNSRELHTDLAVDAIDYKIKKDYRSPYKPILNHTVNTVDCDYFTTDFIRFNRTIEKDYPELDSFVIYICTEGSFSITYNEKESVHIYKGETVLIPAVLKNLTLTPDMQTDILEVFVKKSK